MCIFSTAPTYWMQNPTLSKFGRVMLATAIPLTKIVVIVPDGVLAGSSTVAQATWPLGPKADVIVTVLDVTVA